MGFPVFKIDPQNRRLHSQSGGALVEYILVLTVSVAIILGGIYQLNTAFKVWANNYFGEYLSCLLETGELPSLGGDNTISGQCNENYKRFSLADGRPFVGSGVGGEDGGRNNANDPNSGGQRSVGNDSDTAGDRMRVAGSSGGSSRSSRFRSSTRSGSGSMDGGDIGKEDKLYTGSSKAGVPGGANSQSGPGGDRFRAGGFYGGGVMQEETAKQRVLAGTTKRADGKAKSVTPEKFRAGQIKPKPLEETEIEGFSFGNFFRYLLIAGILIALLIFLGGQALQIGKSME